MKKHSLSAREIFTHPLYFIAFGFGTGLIPWAAGTFGTIVGIPIYLLLAQLPIIYYVILTLIITIFGMWICDIASKKIGIHDFTGINFDEVVGFLWTMIAVPLHWYWVVLGFILFRLFDIWKPWPISWIDEKVHGGFGMVLDDIVAGIVSAIILHVIIFYAPSF